MAASLTSTVGIWSASNILPMIKSLSPGTSKLPAASAIAFSKAFVAIIEVGKPLASDKLMLWERAEMIAFLSPWFKSLGSSSSQIKPRVCRDASLI